MSVPAVLGIGAEIEEKHDKNRIRISCLSASSGRSMSHRQERIICCTSSLRHRHTCNPRCVVRVVVFNIMPVTNHHPCDSCLTHSCQTSCIKRPHVICARCNRIKIKILCPCGSGNKGIIRISNRSCGCGGGRHGCCCDISCSVIV